MKSVLIAADNALKSANEGGNRTSQDVDNKFREAILLLSDFEKDFSSKNPMLDDTGPNIVTREVKIGGLPESESPSTILHVLKKSLHAKVSFHLFPCLSALMNFSQWGMNPCRITEG